MAINAKCEWDVRTTGNDANGGGFDPVSGTPGTDYSQQNAAQIAFTDLVIGATTTQLTSAGNPFTAAHVGNIINITGGTGFTTGRYQVMSVAAGVATMDRSVGTGGSTGGTGNLGGSLATIGTAAGLVVAGNRIHIKAGTYTLTSGAVLAKGTVVVEGYQTTHQDLGTPPLITTATDSTVLITLSSTDSGPVWFVNLSLSNTAGVRANAINAVRGDTQAGAFYRCTFDGFVTAIGAASTTPSYAYLTIDEVEIKNCTSYGVYLYSGLALHVLNSYIHDNDYGIYVRNSSTSYVISHSIIANNAVDGFRQHNAAVESNRYIFHNSTFAGNGSDGVQTGAGGGGMNAPQLVDFVGNIFYGNGGYGVNNPVAAQATFARCNAYGGNTAGDKLNMLAGAGDVALSADPFTNGAGGDFSLNDTDDAGAACKSVGFPGTFPGGVSAGYLDIGAVQTQGAGGDGGGDESYGWMY